MSWPGGWRPAFSIEGSTNILDGSKRSSIFFHLNTLLFITRKRNKEKRKDRTKFCSLRDSQLKEFYYVLDDSGDYSIFTIFLSLLPFSLLPFHSLLSTFVSLSLFPLRTFSLYDGVVFFLLSYSFCLPLPSFYLCFIRFLSYLVPSPVFLMIALELNPHLPPPKQTIFHLLFYSYSHLVFYFSLHFCLIFSLSSFLLFLFRWSINRFVA